ncbi:MULTISPECIES: ester cyclase [unclassified Paraburkholderia]|uniref:ester cyclase n=1 Tax=unclassified Paraburkholderia TaxID=2615204 RepID=UPI002AB71948|nr:MULTISPECIES: ester cyclase [unclassified Paraburkholderia]
MNTQTAFSAVFRASVATLSAATALLGIALPAAAATNDSLVQPQQLIVDKSLPKHQAQQQIRAARLYDTFWSTGDEAQAREALAADFTDRTLPAGRPQGVAGPLAASKVFHGAVPDVHADVEQMIVTGDRVVTHLHFTGHFTGTFNGVQGKGQPVDFIATDIYRIRDGKITDNWHLEDNLTFLQQLGVVAK